MAYWYSIFPNSSFGWSNDYYQSYSYTLGEGNALAYDFISNNVTYTIDNIPSGSYLMFTDSSSNIMNIERPHIVEVNRPYRQSGSNKYWRGRPRLIRSKNALTNKASDDIIKLLSTTTISGKYRIPGEITNSAANEIGGGTLPLKFSINNKTYNYFVFNGNNDNQYIYNGSFYANGFCFGGYVTPITATSFTTTYSDDGWDIFTKTNSKVVKTTYVNSIIDFGDIPQEVPQSFYDWITSNFTPVYPYKYTVKSPDGVTLAEQGELPPIRNITLSTTGNTVNMILSGSNGIDYTLTWSHTVPEGKIFLGLGYAANDKRASIPTGTTTAVTWDSDITVYEIYGKYVPPATTFTITLYQNTTENNRVDKTNYLTSVGSINGTLRSECSIIKPSIIIAQESLPTFNYVYIPTFSRYYFVTGITSVNFGLWRIELSTDVLMTYKDGIESLTAIIARQENDYNDNLIDAEIPLEKQQVITVEEIPNTVLSNQLSATAQSMVLTVIGR